MPSRPGTGPPPDLARHAYQRIAADLREQIHAGRWLPGALLPSRRMLAQEYGVELGTLQQAISGLLADGTLRALPRQGTVVGPADVREPPPRRPAPGEAILGIVAGFHSQPDGPDTLHHDWERIVLSSLERTFGGTGGATRLFNRYGPNKLIVPPAEAMTSLQESGADALAVFLLHDSVEMVASALAAGGGGRTPVVFLTAGPLDRPLPHVYYDQESAGYQAARHLIERGYGPLLFLLPFSADWAEKRLSGAQNAVRHAGLPPTALQVYRADPPPPPWDVDQAEAGRALAGPLLGTGWQGGVGVIGANDAVALGFLHSAAEAGRALGRDFGLVGFDDLAASSLLGLSTVRPPLEALGEEAARLLLNALNGETATRQICLHSHLIPRLSTRRGPALRL